MESATRKRRAQNVNDRAEPVQEGSAHLFGGTRHRVSNYAGRKIWGKEAQQESMHHDQDEEGILQEINKVCRHVTISKG